jgi:hypothetical protein
LSEVADGGHAGIGAAFNTGVLVVALEPVRREVIPDRAWVTLAAGCDYQRYELAEERAGTVDGEHRNVLPGPQRVVVGEPCDVRRVVEASVHLHRHVGGVVLAVAG